jgi:hypothetical protein
MDERHRRQCLLEEYKTLRSEILKRQDARLYVLYITMAIIGAILSFSLKDGLSVLQNQNLPIFVSLMCFSLIVIIASIILTTQYTQQIMTIASYIINYIEDEKIGLGQILHYETRYEQLRKIRRKDKKTSLEAKIFVLPITSSGALALFYLLLTICVGASAFYATLSSPWQYQAVSVLIIIILTVWCSTCLINLVIFKGQNRGEWKKIPWRRVNQEVKKRRNELEEADNGYSWHDFEIDETGNEENRGRK